MFRLFSSHLQAYTLQVKSQDAMHTLGSQCVYISDIFKPYHLLPSGISRNFVPWRGGVQQIQLRTKDRENGDLGAEAPSQGFWRQL